MVSGWEATLNKMLLNHYFWNISRNDKVSPEFVEQGWVRCKYPMLSEDNPLDDPIVLSYLQEDMLKMVSHGNELPNLLVYLFDNIHVLQYCIKIYTKFPNCNLLTEEILSLLWNLWKHHQVRPDDNEIAVSFINQFKYEAERLLSAAGFFYSETYKKAICKSSLQQIEEELIRKTWHPSRVRWWLPHDDYVEIFQCSCIYGLS